MKEVRLHNGLIMPALGYGVYQVTPEECERCVAKLSGDTRRVRALCVTKQ